MSCMTEENSLEQVLESLDFSRVTNTNFPSNALSMKKSVILE